MSIPISFGAGSASIATEKISTADYQIIKVVGGETGSTSVWGITPDGSAKVSVMGTVTTTASGAGSVITVIQSSSVIAVVTGSVATVFQGSVLAIPTSSTIVVWQGSSVIARVTGSVVALPASPSVITVPSGNQSVSGALFVSGSVLLGSSNASVITAAQGSVAVAIVSGSIAATVTPPANQSVSGAVNVSGSVMLGNSNGSVITVWQNSSVLSVPVGSTIAVLQSSSILAVPVGSVITVLQAPSIVGTYAEDTAHATGDKGLLSLNVRNDTLSSVTSADGDYGALAIGPAGEGIFANAPLTKWVRGTADLRTVLGSSVTAIAAQGASIFTYITGVQVVNFGPSSVIVTLAGGLGSVLGYTIAPAGGGSNIVYPNALKTGENSAFTASINGTASVLVSAQGFISKT